MASESTRSADNIWHKIVAGVFASVMAPVLVAFGIKFSDRVLTPAEQKTAAATAAANAADNTAATATPAVASASASPATPAPVAAAPVAVATPTATAPAAAPAAATALASAATPPPSNSAAASGLATAAGSAPAGDAQPAQVTLPSFTKPKSPVERLFNGRDLTGFYTYLGRPHPKAKPFGKNHDPDGVFSVQGGLLRVSGEVPGVLETTKDYTDYWLTVEYKWGEKTSGPDAEGARHSAILVNIDGPDGAIRGASPCAFFVHVVEGATGDLFVGSGQGESHYSLTAAVEEKQMPKGKIAFYTPGAPRTTFAQGLIKRYPPGPLWRDVKGFHPFGDPERPTGEWNTLDIVALNGKLFVRLNDHVVNFAIAVTPTAGRIGIQSHGAEIFFREITLQPYLKHHEKGEHEHGEKVN